MRKHLFIRIIAVILLISLLGSTAVLTVSAADVTNNDSKSTQTISEEKKPHGNLGQKRPYTENLKEINKKLDKLTPEEKTYFQKSVANLKDVKTADQAAGIIVGSLMEIAIDPDNANWKNIGIDAAAGLINLAASCFGFGGVAQAITGPLSGLLKDKAPSEIQLLQEHLDEQFEIVNKGIENIRSDISDLSIKMDESFTTSVSILQNTIKAESAGEKVYAFANSGEGNFDYTLFKNYLYGISDSSNDLARYAYYDKLSMAIVNDAPDEEIEEYYNALYNSLTTVGNERIPYINVLRQYIVEDEFSYSIQRYYYQWLCENRETLEEKGQDAEWEAILFALDLYKTMLFAENCMAVCDNYFLLQIYQEYGLNPPTDAYYKYISHDGLITYVRYSDIKTEMENLYSEERENELVSQMIQDIIYILNVENSYTFQSESGEFYTINNNDADTFGSVYSGQTIYMNKLSDLVCEMFGLDPQKFTYQWSTGEQNSGMLKVPDNIDSLTATLCYGDEEFYTIRFSVNNYGTFSGGSGSEEDPYLICNAKQFDLINTGDDSIGLYYKLINNIDFAGTERAPIGSAQKPFEGVFDGDGYTLNNLSVISNNVNCGLFSVLSVSGIVKNLVLNNAKIGGSQDGATEIFCGGIVGKNNGTVNNCHILNSKIFLERNTSSRQGSCIYMYVGGIAGISAGEESSIRNSSVCSSSVNGTSSRTYKNGKNDNNINSVKVGGIAACLTEKAILENCVVENGGCIEAHAASTDNGGVKSAKVYASVAGITTNDRRSKDYSNIINVYVSSDVKLSVSANSVRGNDDNTRALKYAIVPDIGLGVLDHIEYTMPSRDKIIFPTIEHNYDITTNIVDDVWNSDLNCYNSQVYAYGQDFLKTNNLSIQVDGKTVDAYEIVGHYGLDTLNSDKIDGEPGTVTVLFNTTIDGGIVLLSADIPIYVQKIEEKELIIETTPQTSYEKNEDISIEGGKFVLVWEDGTREEVIPQITSGSTSNYGKSEVEVTYNGISATYTIVVDCLHTYIETTYVSTCTCVGYTEAVCSKCGDHYIVDGSVSDEAEHTIEIRNAVTATCVQGSVGYTGDKYCTVCGECIEKGTFINVLQHEYEYIDMNSCKCKVCKNDNTTKAHEYSSVENDTSIIYSCVTCGYSYTVAKKTTADIARVVVGNSYGVVGSNNEVVVYIKMFNNPGITGVSFRIEYDDRLEYVRYERGDLLLSASEFEVAQANGVIGFVAASPDVYGADGNLLKLIFKLPENVNVMDTYDISIACTRKQFTNGQAKEINIVTMDGYITAVTHLPGDVNNDGFVDVLDTALVARYVAIANTKNVSLMQEFLENQNYNFSEFYADVNLDGFVDLSDLVIMLQYFVGKNVQELTSNEFEVVLNPNNGSLDLGSIIVKCYDENGNRGVYPELPTPTRPGYRFDGWYLSFDVSDLDAERIDAGDQVEYKPEYLKQVLYAHWTEIYTIEYNVNAPPNASSVSGNMNASLFEYDEKKALESIGYNITGWTFKGWSTTPTGAVEYVDSAIVEGLAHAGETVTLYAVWEANTYAVKFKGNQPEHSTGVLQGSMDSIACNYDEIYHLDAAEYKLTGWIFKGWSRTKNGSVEFADQAEVMNLSNVDGGKVELFAIWEPQVYTVKFNVTKPEGASADLIGEMSDMVCYYDTEFTLNPNAYSIVGWVFKGWATSPNDEVVYADGAELMNLTTVNNKTINLYAVWGRHAYTVKYDSNKPDKASNTVMGVITDTLCTYDVQSRLNSNQYSLTGWTFKGWSTTPNGTVEYTDGSEIKNLTDKVNGIVTVYAVWEENTYTIQYETNKPNTATGTVQGVMNDVTIGYEDTIQLTNQYTLEGWSFLGWSSSADGTPIYNNAEQVSGISEKDGDTVTLYAIWGTRFYTIKYNSNKPNCSCVVTGNMSNTNCAYDDPTALKVNSYEILGHKFMGWSTNENGPVEFADQAEVMNLSNVDGGMVELFAIWDAEEYKITYAENGGVNIDDTAFTIHDISSIVVPNATHNSIYSAYNHFEGWYEDSACTKLFDNNLASNPRNITLYAKWSTCVVYDDISATPDITDERVIIDWSNAEGTNIGSIRGNSVLSIANIAKEVIIIGNPDLTFTNMSISLNSFAKDQAITLRLVNFKFTSNVSGAITTNSVDQGVELTIDINGICSVASSATSGNAISGFTNIVRFIGDGDITITAGNGASGSGDGGQGGIAVNATKVVVDMTGNFVAHGGNGGNAYNRPSGDNSGNGSSGRDGYKGGNGGSAITSDSFTITNGNITVIGGNGGRGGDASEGNKSLWSGSKYHGGDGGAGGTGGTAINTSAIIVEKDVTLTATGGNGGNGGTRGGMHEQGSTNAGAQGSGGTGGSAIVSDSTQDIDENAIVSCNNGSNGSAGTGTNVC